MYDSNTRSVTRKICSSHKESLQTAMARGSYRIKTTQSLRCMGGTTHFSRLLGRLSDTANRLADSSGKVTYKVHKANWFVLSGQSGQAIFYAKTLFSHDQFKSFELTYDRSAAALYNPLVSRIASCFTDLA